MSELFLDIRIRLTCSITHSNIRIFCQLLFIKGDAEEKLVYKIIEDAGNMGTWIRDIRVKSNLAQASLTKVLKSLKQKRLVKEVKCVNSTRKIVYMLHHLEPDRSVTGGAWYNDGKDFEAEFVEILNQQCHR